MDAHTNMCVVRRAPILVIRHSQQEQTNKQLRSKKLSLALEKTRNPKPKSCEST